MSAEAIARLREYERGIAEGERRERPRVVADLRRHADDVGGYDGVQLHERADRYERGEHESEGT